MYCPEHLIFESTHFHIWFYDSADRNWFYDSADRKWKNIPIGFKLNPLRYELVFKFGKYPKTKVYLINEEGKFNRKISNFLYTHVRPKLCKWFGIHHHFSFKEGIKYCHHCNLGKEE